jgi:SAM-dependent methyltransferase
MGSFEDYAPYYDLFYRGKDYAAEAEFILGLLDAHAPGARSILELGCGTAAHAEHFVRAGRRVTGVDLSENMVSKAMARFAEKPADERERFRARTGNASDYHSDEIHDAAVSLFHVASYQTSNAALRGYFRSARTAIRDGGVFVFDFWHGPGVLSDRPRHVVREEKGAGCTVTRRTEPVLRADRNVVEVHYGFTVTDNDNTVREFAEVHPMRYLFLPEIGLLADEAGFEVVESGRWMQRHPLSDADWYGFAVLRAVSAGR